MKLSSGYSKKRARIEIIPLIDIVFFLLATFALVSLSSVKNQGVSVHLPKAVSGKPQEIQHIVTVSVTESGELYVDKHRIPAEELPAYLKTLKAGTPDLKVLINGDENAKFGKAIGVLDEIRKLGITKVSIRTKS